MPNPPAKSAHDLVRAIFQLPSEQKFVNGAKMVEAWHMARNEEAVRKKKAAK